MRPRLLALVAVGLLTVGGAAACTDDNGAAGAVGSGSTTAATGGKAKIGVILPDTTTSQRWATDDPKLLKAAFDAAKIPVDIQNAQGDKAKFVQIAEDMITGGVKVLLTVSLDAYTGKIVLDRAKAAGVKTIDYDRLTLNGGANYYVSFDNVQVGRLQGAGLIKCLDQQGARQPLIADLNGSSSDNNAKEFKLGSESVLQTKYDDGLYVKGPDQAVAGWDTTEAGTVFTEMWRQTGKQIRGVLAANDGLANAAIEILKQDRMNGRVPVTGQDATVQGLQNVLAGDQCMTVYKPIRKEAQAAADLAVKLYRGERPATPGRVEDPESGAYVPAVLLAPAPIFKKDVGRVIRDGFADRKAVCAGRFAALCRQNGIK